MEYPAAILEKKYGFVIFFPGESEPVKQLFFFEFSLI